MQNPVPKKTIAVDIDDVLAANAKGFTEYSNRKWGTRLTPDDYTEHWAELWEVDHDEVERRRRAIINDKLFTEYDFFDEVKPVLYKLKNLNYRLVVVSSRGSGVQQDTVGWLKREYGNLFDGIYFADMWDKKNITMEERLSYTKNDILKSLEADYLIDDQPKHCIAAAKSGITALLFGDYKWNKDTKLATSMVRTKNWQEVLEYFNAQG